MSTLEDITKVKNELNELSDNTRKLVKNSIDDLSLLINSYDKLFNTSNENLVDLLATSENLRNVHDELKGKIEAQGAAITEVNNELKEQRETALIDEKMQLEIIKDMQNQRRVLNEMAELSNKLTDTSLSLNHDEVDKINDRITLLTRENNLITKKYNDKKVGHLNEYRYAMELSTTQASTLDKLENINVLQEKAANSAREYASESERAEKALAKQSKKITAVAEGAKTLWGYAVKIQESWADFNDLAYKSGRAMGMNHDQLKHYQRTLMRDTVELAAKYGVAEKVIIGFQDEYAKSTSRSILLTNEQKESMTAMSKLAGEGVVHEVAGELDNFGVSIDDAMVNLGITQERAMKYGLNASKSGELFAKNIKLASQYTFKNGIDGISKMTLISQRLKFNLESIGSAADNFSTIEGAIGTSAKLQMLGGSYASNFGNPMTVMYEAMNDLPALMDRVTKTFASKGVFNKKTGEVEVSSMDKRFIKEAAASMGISYNDAINMTMNQGKFNEIESQINDKQGFSDANKTAIGSLATWDSDKQAHIIKFIDIDGKEKKQSVKKLDKETLQYIQRQTMSEENLQKDVREIAKLIKSRFKVRASSTVTYNERKEGLVTTKKGVEGEGSDGIMNVINDALTDITSSGIFRTVTSLGGLYLTLSALTRVGTKVVTSLGGKSIGNMLKRKATVKTKGKGGGKPKPKPSGGGGGGGKPKGGVGSAAQKGAKSLIKKGGKKALIGATIAIASGLLLSSNSSSEEGYEANKSIRANEESNIGNSDESIVSELYKQTELLEIIAGLKSRDSYVSSYDSETDDGSMFGASTIAQMGVYSGLWGASTKIGGKFLEKVGGSTGLKMAAGATKMMKAGNPLGWLSMGTDTINWGGQATGLWDEGSHTDKLMNVGSSALEGASYGAMIGTLATSWLGPGAAGGGAIGGAIGAALGGIKGVVDNYGDDIKHWAVGKNNLSNSDKMQAEYEVNKFGATSIFDPQLGEKAALATVKMHDVLVSMWHHMNGKQTNGTVEDKGFFGGIFDFGGSNKSTSSNKSVSRSIGYEQLISYNNPNNVDTKVINAKSVYLMQNDSISRGDIFTNSNVAKSVFNMIGGNNNTKEFISPSSVDTNNSNVAKSPVNMMNRPFSGIQEMSPRINPININSMIEPVSIRSTSNIGVVGDSINPLHRNDGINSQYKQSLTVPDINLNVSGSIKLVADSKNVDIDIKKLLDNPSFKESLIKMVKDGLDRNQGLGKINRNNITTQRTSSGYKN